MRVGVTQRGIHRIPHLTAFLDADSVTFRPLGRNAPVDAVAGWGEKTNTARARRWAQRVGCPYWRLEDGFLRSVRPGVTAEPRLSMVVDPVGIYYDATQPSALENMLNVDAADDPLQRPETLDRADRCMRKILAHRLSKYNHAPCKDLESSSSKRVLVVDQTRGDLSLEKGLVHEGGFDFMLQSALEEHPDAEIWVKTHPEVISGKKAGHFAGSSEERVQTLEELMNPIHLLEQVDEVYVMTSLMGWEALMVGKPVHTFGVPFYAGWGLTNERVQAPCRTRARTLQEVFAAAYLEYSRYVDPETERACALERIIDHLALQTRCIYATRGTLVCLGFSSWKRSFVPAFVAGPGTTVRFEPDAQTAQRKGLPRDAKLLVWGAPEPLDARDVATNNELPLWRMEDGFLRSVGLGSDLHRPASLVVDTLGLYYDPRRPSELEELLLHAEFSEEELFRARELQHQIVQARISKYNFGGSQQLGASSSNRPTLLVVGQVEDDASIRLGTPFVRTNAELLKAVRRARPNTRILFKPHPDVVSGNRQGKVIDPVGQKLCHEVAERATVHDCLDVVDEVHTMTSLVGFEALLHGKHVVVYGQPFYAGWGLTEDHRPVQRRGRRRSLEELVAATLIRYPRYVSYKTGAFTTPERIVEQLRTRRDQSANVIRKSSYPRRQLRKAVHLIRTISGVR